MDQRAAVDNENLHAQVVSIMARTKPTKREPRGRHGEALVRGATLLAHWLDHHGITFEQAATALATTRGCISLWCSGHMRPRAEVRLAIERYTSHAVPALSWLSKNEAAYIRSVSPRRAS